VRTSIFCSTSRRPVGESRGEFWRPFTRREDLGEAVRENVGFIALLRVFLLGFCMLWNAGLASAQSHPGWWTVVPPESQSLVGIEWQTLRNSPFGDALRVELSTGGSVALPDLPCLMNAHDFLMASPPLLAAANGGCAPATLRTEAPAHGLKLSSYRGFDLWVPLAASELSVLQFNERVVLIGSVKSLRAAVDRSLVETRTYSPLLIQGARLARTRDLWAVAAALPDPLASIFVPLEVASSNVRNFEGGITLREGLDLGAILDAGSEAGAAEVAGSIRKSIPQFPGVVKGLQVATNGSSVTLALQVPNDVLQASLRRGDSEVASESEPPGTLPAPVAPRASAAPAPKTPAVSQASKVSAAPVAASPAPPAPGPPPAPIAPSDAPVVASASAVAVEPAKPERQVIRIYGLDEGTREIVLPPKEP
jgi:hypothetical protein